jgi:hypothetical protein
MNDEPVDVSKIRDLSDITEELIEKLSSKDAIYLREKFGSRLDSYLLLKEIAEKFSIKEKKRLEEITRGRSGPPPEKTD